MSAAQRAQARQAEVQQRKGQQQGGGVEAGEHDDPRRHFGGVDAERRQHALACHVGISREPFHLWAAGGVGCVRLGVGDGCDSRSTRSGRCGGNKRGGKRAGRSPSRIIHARTQPLTQPTHTRMQPLNAPAFIPPQLTVKSRRRLCTSLVVKTWYA